MKVSNGDILRTMTQTPSSVSGVSASVNQSYFWVAICYMICINTVLMS